MPYDTDVSPLKLKAPLPRDLFSTQAEEAAKRCVATKNSNAASQIRRFYDELAMWAEQVMRAPAAERENRFREVEPYIQMLRAKAAYALSRKLITEEFNQFIRSLVSSIDSPESLENGKLFFEAFLGFKKCFDSLH